ncbi:hypothetical protein DFH11DRAFT_1558629 [Phellopilus nigrolimitatus]|nr:hypothetical protein DFH11DRAFT_1558629 [Phellopilus nigrolimitatus]
MTRGMSLQDESSASSARSCSRPERNVDIGGKPAALLFALMLLAFVTESQLTQYVQSDLDYRQPYLLFFIAHSAMIIIFPLHLFYLHIATPFSVLSYLRGLSWAIKGHLSNRHTSPSSQSSPFPIGRLLAILSWFTVGITIPGLLWFAAISLASVSDVTAIWNSNAFWAYILSVKLRRLPWEPIRLASVAIAILGVFIVVYGSKHAPELAGDEAQPSDLPKAPLLGNTLTLIASFGYGLYQVSYNMYAVPPFEAEPEHGAWQSLCPSSDNFDEDDEDDEGTNSLENVWPSDWSTLFAVGGIALSAVAFLTTFMILLGVWGPIITSVGNLLTIVLVIISDLIFGNGVDTLTIWSLLGSAMIVSAFAVLAYDSFRT